MPKDVVSKKKKKKKKKRETTDKKDRAFSNTPKLIEVKHPVVSSGGVMPLYREANRTTMGTLRTPVWVCVRATDEAVCISTLMVSDVCFCLFVGT